MSVLVKTDCEGTAKHRCAQGQAKFTRAAVHLPLFVVVSAFVRVAPDCWSYTNLNHHVIQTLIGTPQPDALYVFDVGWWRNTESFTEPFNNSPMPLAITVLAVSSRMFVCYDERNNMTLTLPS